MNGEALIVNTIKTAPFFCVCPVYIFVFTNMNMVIGLFNLLSEFVGLFDYILQ
jgi:hypothetical protein